MLLVPNRDVVIPFAKDIYLEVPINTNNDNRFENRQTLQAFAEVNVPLTFTPTSKDWVEVYLDGLRVLNPRVKSQIDGTRYEVHNVVQNNLIFSVPITGDVTIICDTHPVPNLNGTLIDVLNVQGFKSARASLYMEPVVMSEPINGHARLSLDRQSMVYVPNLNFTGDDSFSYCLINNHGQYSKNFCVYITVS